MKKTTELKWNQLKMSYQSTDFAFETTEDFQVTEVVKEELGALEFGLKINAKGYNVYLSGVDEESMLEYVITKVEEQAKQQPVPEDICYIYNFKYPSIPKLVCMTAGEGNKFKNDMIEFKHFIIDELPQKLEGYDIERKKQKLILELEEKKEALVEEIKEQAEEMGFNVKLTKEGIGFSPISNEDEEVEVQEQDEVKKKTDEEIKEELGVLYEMAEEVIEVIQELEVQYAQEINNIDEAVIIREAGNIVKKLKGQYSEYETLQEYFDWIYDDIIENIALFIGGEKEDTQGIKELFPWIVQKGPEEIIGKYQVNLLVDHSEDTHAPVMQVSNLNYNNLIGSIKIDNELTTSHVDYRNIRPGVLHQANGGYVLIKISDLLEYPGAWEGIKRVLKTESITIENLMNANIATTIGITPEPLGAKLKVILIGSYDIYRLLLDHDRTFKDYFKINIDFEEIVESNKECIEGFINQVKKFCDKEDLPHVTRDGIMRLLEISHREAESQTKISSNMQGIYDVIREANLFANEAITKEDIVHSQKIKCVFKDTLQKNVEERYDKNILMVDTVGKKVGQINGLAVYSIDYYNFGRPMRITATTYRGKSGVVDLETEVGLSGSIHSKGVQIITGFLGSHFAKEFPLSLSCRICFEQNYGGIDGDSASAAELFAVLSSLSDIPLRQGIAVTGSINQYGEIQPVGGVNDKIEGFYKICKKKGLTGNQGVILPYQNAEDLVLEEEVIEAVKDGKFHIYAIQNFKQGIQILTDTSYKKLETSILDKLRDYSDVDKKE